MAINVRIYTSGTVYITDMANAGKRGRKCRRLHVQGWRPCAERGSIEWLSAERTANVIYEAEQLTGAEDFDSVRERFRDLVAKARAEGVPEHGLNSWDDEIRGVDAPRPKLTAGVEGVWFASADENGITLRALNDPYNEWTETTGSKQSPNRAYDLAAKVWGAVQRAQTLNEASGILQSKGVNLHGYCAID